MSSHEILDVSILDDYKVYVLFAVYRACFLKKICAVTYMTMETIMKNVKLLLLLVMKIQIVLRVSKGPCKKFPFSNDCFGS